MAKKFAPATDEVWRLQRGDDPECVFFQTMAENGHYGGRPGASRQGIYVCAPSGKFLASVNSTSPDRVLRTMQQGLEVWEKLSVEERALTEDSKIKPKHRWEDSYPEGGLVLNMFTRDLPESGKPEEQQAAKWNQDPVWFSKSEARNWLATELELGVEHVLPRPLVMRLARLHLVDMVKGQTIPFSEDEIKDARIAVTPIEIKDGIVKVEITGQTKADSTRKARRTSPHGVTTNLMGSAIYDLEKQSFTQFELTAIGNRWGHTRFNGRRRDSKEGLLGFVFRLADANQPRIAPAFIYNYEADWVKHPNR